MYPPTFSEARQPCTKGLSRSLTLGSFWAPHHSTLINVFELFFCCPVIQQDVSRWTVPLSTSGTPNHVGVCYRRSTGGKSLSLLVRQEPIKNSILQHWEVTVKAFHQFVLTGEPYWIREYCRQPLHMFDLLEFVYIKTKVTLLGSWRIEFNVHIQQRQRSKFTFVFAECKWTFNVQSDFFKWHLLWATPVFTTKFPVKNPLLSDISFYVGKLDFSSNMIILSILFVALFSPLISSNIFIIFYLKYIGGVGATESKAWIGNFNVKARKTVEHILPKIG